MILRTAISIGPKSACMQRDAACAAAGQLVGFARWIKDLAGQTGFVSCAARRLGAAVRLRAIVAISPFPLLSKRLKSDVIKTQKRGFVACVNHPSLSWQLPRWPCRAVSKTAIRLPTMPPCAPSVVRPQAPLLPAPRAAAKPKARLLVRWRAAYLAVFRASRPATDLVLIAPKPGTTSVYL
jgi:hypothetical protein